MSTALPLWCLLGFGLASCHPTAALPKDTGHGPDEEDSEEDSGADSEEDSADSVDTEVDPDPVIEEDVWVEPWILEAGGSAVVHYAGVFSDQEQLFLLYGFNGWNEVEGVKGLERSGGDRGNNDFFVEAPMERIDGEFRATVSIPAQARSLHFCVYYEQLIEPETGDTGGPTIVRNTDCDGGDEYHREIFFPYIGPFLTWDDRTEPENGIVVNFETGVSCRGRVEWGTSPELGSEVLGEETRRIHHIPLTGLSPDTDYYYRLHDNVGHVSEIYHFRTAAEDLDAFSFIAISDIQDDGEHGFFTSTLGELLANHGDAAFLLIAGDMAASEVPGQWWRFFDLGRPLFSEKPILPTPGNHDTPGSMHSTDNSAWEEYFALPMGSGSETFYRRDYGNATFLSMNSELTEDLLPDGRQYLWMNEQLGELGYGDSRTRDWVIAFDHVPFYNVGLRHGNEQLLYRPITELFDGAVDWVISGHEHLYQRSVPIWYDGLLAPSGQYGDGELDGVGYLVLPPASAAPSPNLIPEEAVEAESRLLMAFPEIAPGQVTTESEIGFLKIYLDRTTWVMESWSLGDGTDPAHQRDTLHYAK